MAASIFLTGLFITDAINSAIIDECDPAHLIILLIMFFIYDILHLPK